MKTVAQCVGGCADGVELNPPDSDEPDDWPDEFTIIWRTTGVSADYSLRRGPPKIMDGNRVYFYDVVRK
jgi:hypothetical protein